MANYVGAVRFPDGDLRFFSYQGTVDTARRILFATADEVTHQQDFIPAARSAPDEEPVEVMPYFEHGSKDVVFHSRASRSLELITGPNSMDQVMYEENETRGSPWA